MKGPALIAGKVRSIALLLVVELAALSLWFVSAAVLPEMAKEVTLSHARQAAMSSGVQAGFVVGALISSILGLPDRFDPRRVLALSAIGAGLVNALLLVVEPGGNVAIAARAATGALLAGVYPVGMKIAVGWGEKDRGFLTGALVGALTIGTASPHLLSFLGGADWRLTVLGASLAAIAAGFVALAVGLGPYHRTAPAFDPHAVRLAWSNRRVRLAYAGYLGHMWELFAMWAWIAAATTASYATRMAPADALQLAKLTAFVAIAAGGVACVIAGYAADRIGKAQVAALAMALSGTSAIAAALAFGGPVWLMFAIVVVWGIGIVADSAQFSALVADAAPADKAGSLMTFQTALGYALTTATVQVTPVAAAAFGWPVVFAAM
ncbi:MAG: MFS transporter, partial [Hyphomicrobiaceae bacterium]